MKKIILTLALLTGMTSASAQMTDHISNIQANLGGGIHTLLYTPTDGEHSIGLGGVVELQYQYMFNHNWGIGIGLQVNTLRSTATYNYAYTLPETMRQERCILPT